MITLATIKKTCFCHIKWINEKFIFQKYKNLIIKRKLNGINIFKKNSRKKFKNINNKNIKIFLLFIFKAIFLESKNIYNK